MSKANFGTFTALGLMGSLFASPCHAETADAEIAALKQQLRLMEQKLERLQKQTTANTAAAASASAKVEPRVSIASANASYMAKSPIAPPDATVKMPGNR